MNWEKISRSIAWLMPKSIVMWCFYRVWANATSGKWSNEEVPAVTCSEAIRRW